MNNERKATGQPGLEVERHSNQLYFGQDTDPGGLGQTTMFCAVAVFGGFIGELEGEPRPGIAMSVRTDDDHPEVARALIESLRNVADQLETMLAAKEQS